MTAPTPLVVLTGFLGSGKPYLHTYNTLGALSKNC